MRIGIPRALLYYYYFPFWKAMFTYLGCEVVVSDETNAKIIADNSKVTVSELCVPVKIFNGHVINLLEKEVDLVFVPRFVKMKGEFYCPKFMGITEIAKYSIKALDKKLLAVDITSTNDVIDKYADYLPVKEALGLSKPQLKSALKAGREQFLKFRALCREGYTVLEAYDALEGKPVQKHGGQGEVKIALMGYVNNIYDNFVSMNIIEKLRSTDCAVVTFDMLPEASLYGDRHKKQPFWVFARKIYNASAQLLKAGVPDGMIHLTAFGCGPDSVIGKLMELDCEQAGVPFMTLRVDEHTGESHVQTRLEAFIDMLKQAKRKERKD